jgi:hypothetical protein
MKKLQKNVVDFYNLSAYNFLGDFLHFFQLTELSIKFCV